MSEDLPTVIISYPFMLQDVLLQSVYRAIEGNKAPSESPHDLWNFHRTVGNINIGKVTSQWKKKMEIIARNDKRTLTFVGLVETWPFDGGR